MKKESQVIESIEIMPGDQVMSSEADMLDDMVVTEEDKIPIMVIDSKPKDFDWDKNKDFSLFLQHINNKLNKIPAHSGQTTLGCHRAVQFFKKLDKEISDGFGEDFDCAIDEKQAEDLRKQIKKMIKGLEERGKKIHEAYDNDGAYASVEPVALVKNADDEVVNDSCATDVVVSDPASAKTMTCEACNVDMLKTSENEFCCVACEKRVNGDKQEAMVKEAGTPKFSIVITPFEQAVASAIINGSVSNGKNPEAIYAHMVKKYKLSAREELSIQQILLDMGYSFIKDRGLLGETDQNPLGNGVELATNYSA
jgi:hypothetical protein